ncbi:tricorn protease domain 2-containing protein [Rhizopogon salebrosus TDB-379]|nr:tricorn protease domain 2-containing protein [Rhizopogon salebrosus TDB-379]
MTLKGPESMEDELNSDEVISNSISSVAYFQDCKRMISGSRNGTVRQWDLEDGKEIEEARDVCKQLRVGPYPVKVAVSKDSRWVVAAGAGSDGSGELTAYEVETGIVKTFHGHQSTVFYIDISADSKLLASVSYRNALIYNLESGGLMVGFEIGDSMHGSVRFSHDSKKVALMSLLWKCLEVWDIDSQTLDVRVGRPWPVDRFLSHAPVFWTTKDKTILAAFSFTDGDPRTIYEFDASTLQTVGAPFEGHTDAVTGLALSLDDALLVSASHDANTIQLWAFQSRQVLASFHAEAYHIILSPHSRQLAYTTGYDPEDANIYVCNIPHDILDSIQPSSRPRSSGLRVGDLLNFDATTRPVTSRNLGASPFISVSHRPLRTPPSINSRQHIFLRHVRKLLPSLCRNAVPPVGNNELHDPLDVRPLIFCYLRSPLDGCSAGPCSPPTSLCYSFCTCHKSGASKGSR